MMPARSVASAAALAVVVALPMPAGAYQRPGHTERVSVASDGSDSAQGTAGSFEPAISADGRHVAFTSVADTLVPGDTNQASDVFVHDRKTGVTERVSVASDGAEGDNDSWHPAISGDGRYVAFTSVATNLDPRDSLCPGLFSPGPCEDVFVHDRDTGVTERVSVASDGTEADHRSGEPSISAGGQVVAFTSFASNLVPDDTNAEPDVFVHDRKTGTTERVSVTSDATEADDRSAQPSISADGQVVAFTSFASNLVPDDTNGWGDVFVHDRDTGLTERVSVGTDGMQGNELSGTPSLSADGRHVAFASDASTLVPGDTNAARDIFAHDREAGTTERVSVASDGVESERFVDAYEPAISGDGRYVAFESSAANLVPGIANAAMDVFVHDRKTGATERASAAGDGAEANSHSVWSALSGDGRHVAFHSGASNLVPDDDNATSDVFVRHRGPALGVGEVAAVLGQGQLSVAGWARFSGRLLTAADDPPDDGDLMAEEEGAELTGASVTYRPEIGDLLLQLHLASLPRSDFGGAGRTGILYGFEFDVDGVRYETRALRSLTADPMGAPYFALYRCETLCLETARLSGGIGTTGPEVRVAVPLGTVDTDEGAAVTGIRAFTALGEATPGGLVVLDEVALPDAAVPTAQMLLGVAPAGTPQSEVVFDVQAALSGGFFSAEVEAAALQPGAYEVWGKGCLGAVCGTASAPLGGVLPRPPPPAQTSTDTGHIVGSNPASPMAPRVTEQEFVLLGCDGPPQTQGADGYVIEVPPEFGQGSATATVRGPGWPWLYDLDLVFYTDQCQLVGQSATSDPDETARVPAGTAFVVVNAYTGVDTDFTLTVSMPGSSAQG